MALWQNIGTEERRKRVRRRSTRIMLVDDHEGFRQALGAVLRSRDGIELMAEAGSGEEALELIAGERPDIVLMDFALPGMNGLEATREIVARGEVAVIGLSMHPRGAYATEMRRAGAKGWVTKGGAIAELWRVIERVSQGENAWEESPTT